MEQLTLGDAPLRRTTDPDTSQPPPEHRLSAGRATALEAHFWAVDPALIEATDQRRPSPTGSPSIVWKITPAGISWHRASRQERT